MRTSDAGLGFESDDFESAFLEQSGQTTGNALLKQYYTAITGKAAPATLNFNDALINDIDSFQQIVTTAAAVKLAGNLRLGLA